MSQYRKENDGVAKQMKRLVKSWLRIPLKTEADYVVDSHGNTAPSRALRPLKGFGRRDGIIEADKQPDGVKGDWTLLKEGTQRDSGEEAIRHSVERIPAQGGEPEKLREHTVIQNLSTGVETIQSAEYQAGGKDGWTGTKYSNPSSPQLPTGAYTPPLSSPAQTYMPEPDAYIAPSSRPTNNPVVGSSTSYATSTAPAECTITPPPPPTNGAIGGCG